MKRILLSLVVILLFVGLAGCRIPTNVPPDTEIDVIYYRNWAVFGTQEDTTAYKIDFVNQTVSKINSYASDSTDEWGTESGDADFVLLRKLDNDSIDTFFKESARLGFTGWDSRYEDRDALDGSSWYVRIVFSDGTTKEMLGINEYPETWDEMIAALDDLIGEPTRR